MSEDATGTTLPDGADENLFGRDVPVELWGPVIARDGLLGGMVCRFIRSDTLGKERKPVHVFQIDTAQAQCFVLWGTAELNGKLRQVKKGTAILIQYLGQSDDVDRTHRWLVKPFQGGGRDWIALVKGERWSTRLEAMERVIQHAAGEERARRAAQGDGAPPHDDRDAHDGFGRDLRR